MTTKTLAPTDPRFLFGMAIRTGTEVVSQVRPDQLTGPTPCDEMTVRDLLQHLVSVLDRVTALGRGEDPFAVPMTDAADDGWFAAWLNAAHRLQDVWTDDALLDVPMSLPWLQGTGADLLLGYVSEVTVHTWDLARAVGLEPAWDEAAVATALELGTGLPAEGRLELFTQISQQMGLPEVAIPFADPVPVPEGAPAIDRLVAWNGRRPDWRA